MRILVDMNLSPSWVGALRAQRWDAVHWSEVGDGRASDSEIMAWARQNRCVVFTHDLDFGAALALTRTSGPSVIQVRTQDALPDRLASAVVRVLEEQGAAIETGALVVIDETRCRVRILPL